MKNSFKKPSNVVQYMSGGNVYVPRKNLTKRPGQTLPKLKYLEPKISFQFF